MKIALTLFNGATGVEKGKAVADVIATSTVVSAVLGWLPAIAAGFAMIYTIYRIYDLWDLRRREKRMGRSRLDRAKRGS